jgi:hypothetical protein
MPTGNEPSEYVNARIEEIQNMDVPENEKELLFRIGTQIFDVQREMGEYSFQQAYAFILDAFDVVYSMIKNERNNKYDIPTIKDIARDSEKIFEYIQKIQILMQRIDTNTQGLERKVKRENTEREKIIGQIVGEMRNQNP